MTELFLIETANDYSNKYFPARVGSSLQWGSNIRAMVRGRENLAYKCTGTISNKIGSISLHQREKSESHTPSEGQKAALSYLLKMEGAKNEYMFKLSKEIWHYLLNHKISVIAEYLLSVLNTVADRESRKKKRLFRVASSSQSFSSGFSTTKFSDNRSICFLPMP